MLKTAYYELTTSCVMQCKHCLIPYILRYETPLTRNFEDAIIDFSILKKLNVSSLVLSGGEPTLHPQFLNIVKFATKMFKTAIISNNSNPNLLKEADKATIWVSLDFYGETQDEWRGYKGLWHNYLSIADIANVRTTLLRNNVKHIEKIIQTTVQHKRRITIVPYKGKNPQLTPTPRQLQQLLLYIFKNKLEKQAVVDEPCIREWLLTKIKQPHQNLCSACETVIKINPRGKVQPCPFLNDVISDLRDPQINEKISQHRQKIVSTYTGKCVNCKLRTVCGGCKTSLNNYCFL